MQITKLSFLSTQSLGDNVFAVEEVVDIPIDQVFGTHRAREKALINLIGSDGVQKIDRDTWKIVKDITLEAANVTMRQGDFFRVKLDEEGDDSPVHFDLDATGVFVLSRDVFASLQTYSVLEPGKQQAIRLQFTFGGKPVVDAKLTSKFSSLTLEPVDATNGIYELQFYTAMAPSDDILTLEITGVSLRNSVYEAPVRVTVREPILTLVPVDLELHAEQTKDITWQLLMEGRPAPASTPLQAVPKPFQMGDTYTDLIAKVGPFKLIDAAKAIYSLNVKATDEVGLTSIIDTTYNFGSDFVGEINVPITLLSKESLYVTHDTTILEANQTQLIQITLKLGATAQRPVTDATAVQISITGACIQSVDPELVVIDAAKGIYAYRVTTNHKGGPISIRSVLSTNGNPYPDFDNLTARSTSIQVRALNTLPAAETADLTFSISQQRLGGLTPLVGVQARTFTVGGSAIAKINGPVEAVGQGVYKLNLTTNNVGGNVPVKATLTIDGEDFEVEFLTTAAVLPSAVLTGTGPALTGETVQAVPLKTTLSGANFDLGKPTYTLSGMSLMSSGILRRTGVGLLEIGDVNVNGKGGTLNVTVTGTVKGYSQRLQTTLQVNPVSNILASDVTHLRPTIASPIQFTLLRDGQPLTSMKVGKATISGSGFTTYDGTVETLDANTGRFQVRSVTGSAPPADTYFQIALPVVIKGYSYMVVFNSYTEAMPTLGTGGGSSSNPGAGNNPGAGGGGTNPPGSLNPGGQLSGGLDQEYCMSWTVDGKPANVESGTVTGSGSVLLAGPDPVLRVKGDGIACMTGISTSDQAGDIMFDGTIVIDGITHPFHFVLHNNRMAPTVTNVTVLEPEATQTLYFDIMQGPDIVTNGILSNGAVLGDNVVSYEGFALDDAAAGRYRVVVTTADKEETLRVAVNVSINGTDYPLAFDAKLKGVDSIGDGTGWKLVATPITAARTSPLRFSFRRGGQAVENSKAEDIQVTGTNVVSTTDDATTLGTGFQVSKVKLNSTAGTVTLKATGSLNGVTKHALETSFPVAQATTPIVTPQAKMLVARVQSVLTFTLTRDGLPVTADAITNVRVSGDPVQEAKQDVIVVNAASGQYGTTVTPNDLGGNITVLFDLNEGGVDYKDLTFTGKADIYHPWSATLKTGPKPEILSFIDIESHLDNGDLVAIESGTATVTGDCLVAPLGEVTLVYQNTGAKIYRIPNVMVNNKGGELTVNLKVIYEGAEIEQELKYTVTALPALTITSPQDNLPFRQTVDVPFTVNRGSENPSVFTNADVKNLSIGGTPVAGYTPTIVAVGAGSYKVSVQTNSYGGQLDVSFTVTLAGIDYPLSFSRSVLAEPGVDARSLNTLQTNTTATNLDFQLMRGTLPCADAFVVQKVEITGRSVTSWPQSVINVDVSQGKYRMQVNTSAYSDDAKVKITGTVRGEGVVLNFTVKVAVGVLPTITLTSSAFDENLPTSAVLAFMNGTTAITSGITLDSIDGPITDPVLSAASPWTLKGTPTKPGKQMFTVNFSWKGASYSSDVEIPVTPIYPAVLSTTDRLIAYKNNVSVFSMLGEDGQPYPTTGFTYSVATPTYVSSGSLPIFQQTDGTFGLGLSANTETERAPVTILVTEKATGKTRKHAFWIEMWYDLEARFTGTTVLDSSAISNLVQFDVYEKVRNLTWSVYTKVTLDSLRVVGKGDVNNVTGWSSFTIGGNPGYRGTFYVSTNPVDVVDADYTFNWNSPLGRVYPIKGSIRMQAAPSVTWASTPALKGSETATFTFKLVSGTTPIQDAINASTTVTNGVIAKAPYLIDAATGTYGIDITPAGNASSMDINLVLKQPSVPTAIITLPKFTRSVTPAPVTVVAARTLPRNPKTETQMDVLVMQGNVNVTNFVINSWTVSQDSIYTITGPQTYGGTNIIRWVVKTAYTGASPKITLNLTVGGVGYNFTLDYPIDPAATLAPNIAFFAGNPMKNVLVGSVRFGVTVNGAVTDMAGGFGTPTNSTVVPDGMFVATSDNVQLVNAVVMSGNSGYLTLQVVPLKSGAQTWTFNLTQYGVVYPMSVNVTVDASGTITILSGTPVFAEMANTVVFSLKNEDGSSLDGSETLSGASGPTYWPSLPVTRNADGTYQVTVTPSGESAGKQLKLTVTKNGVATTFVSTYSIDTYFKFKMVWSANTEVAGNTLSLQAKVVSAISGKDITTLASWSLTNTGGGPDLSSFKYTISDPNALDNSVPVTPRAISSTLLGFTMKTNLVDYASFTMSIEAVSPVTKLRYLFVSDVGCFYDTVVTEMLGPTVLSIGRDNDVKFKMTYQTSGNPVKVAVMPRGGNSSAGIFQLRNQFKDIDRENGVYAITYQPVTTADSGSQSLWLRYGMPDSIKTTGMTLFAYTTQLTAYRAVKMAMPALAKATRKVPIVLKNVDGPITDATITSIEAGTYLTASSGNWTAVDATSGIYLVDVTTKPDLVIPNIGNLTGVSPVTVTDQVSISYTTSKGETVTETMSAPMVWIWFKLAGANNAPIKSDNQTYYLPEANGVSLAGYSANNQYLYDLTGKQLYNSSNSWYSGGYPGPGLAIRFGKGFFGDHFYSGGSVTYQLSPGNYVPYYTYYDDFSIVRAPYYLLTPYAQSQSVFTGNASAIPPFQFADMVVTITDETGVPIKGAYIDAPMTWSPTADFIGFDPEKSGGTDWSKALVPVTDGSDGKYYIRLYFKGYYHGVTAQSFSVTMNVKSSDYPDVTTSLSIAVAINR